MENTDGETQKTDVITEVVRIGVNPNTVKVKGTEELSIYPYIKMHGVDVPVGLFSVRVSPVTGKIVVMYTRNGNVLFEYMLED